MMLGLGTGAPEALRAFHGTDGETPIPRMREYIEVLRRSWDYLASGAGPAFDGAHYRFNPPPVNPWGARELVRPQIPIYLAAMKPQMLALAGRLADGWIGYFFTPGMLDEYVRPHLEKGARKAGRNVDEIEMSVEMVCSISVDRRVAMARARRQVGFYAVHPTTNFLMADYGLAEDVRELRRRFRAEGVEAFAHTRDRKSTRLNSSHIQKSRMPSSA